MNRRLTVTFDPHRLRRSISLSNNSTYSQLPPEGIDRRPGRLNWPEQDRVAATTDLTIRLSTTGRSIYSRGHFDHILQFATFRMVHNVCRIRT